MSARTDLVDDLLLAVVDRHISEVDEARRAALWRLAQAVVLVWRAVYRREARLSRMHSAYRRRRRR